MSEWTKTEADALPWGEVVEVRFNSGDTLKLEPCIESGVDYWFDDDNMYFIQGSEWRRLERGPGDNDA